MTDNLDDIRSEFIEKVGLFAQGDRLPRIAGRVLGLLVWDGAAIPFGDLADKLQVSRGSISTATRILEDRRLIKRVAKAGQRQDFFQLSDNPYANMLAAERSNIDLLSDEVTASLNKIPANEPEIRARVAAYGKLFKVLSKAVGEAIDEV